MQYAGHELLAGYEDADEGADEERRVQPTLLIPVLHPLLFPGQVPTPD
jgi:hypothetical protein